MGAHGLCVAGAGRGEEAGGVDQVVNKPPGLPVDAALLERFRRGEPQAFDEIVTAHRGAVYGVARRLLKNHGDADEAAQLAFVRAWGARKQFRGEAALRTWLIRIVLNVGKSMLASRRPNQGLDEAPDVADSRVGAAERLRRSEAQAQVRRAVAELPSRQREVVVLKVFSEMTYREVAQVMQLSEGAVKAHLHQAVANLRRIMSEQLAPMRPAPPECAS